MDTFSSFYNSYGSTQSRWSYDSLKNFRQISPHVQAHLKKVLIFLANIFSLSISVCFASLKILGKKKKKWMEVIGEARSYVVEMFNFVIFLFIWHFLGEFRFCLFTMKVWPKMWKKSKKINFRDKFPSRSDILNYLNYYVEKNRVHGKEMRVWFGCLMVDFFYYKCLHILDRILLCLVTEKTGRKEKNEKSFCILIVGFP